MSSSVEAGVETGVEIDSAMTETSCTEAPGSFAARIRSELPPLGDQSAFTRCVRD